jgi:hypothetical protein
MVVGARGLDRVGWSKAHGRARQVWTLQRALAGDGRRQVPKGGAAAGEALSREADLDAQRQGQHFGNNQVWRLQVTLRVVAKRPNQTAPLSAAYCYAVLTGTLQ